MQQNYVIDKIIERKKEIGWTIEIMARESGVGIRTINRLLAGQDVRFSSIEALLHAMSLNLMIDTKLSA